MSASNSTKSSPSSKPSRPPDAVLFWHASGRWAKKIRGKLHYFGRSTYDEAFGEYERQKEYLHAGLRPPEEPQGLTVYSLCCKFLTTKKHLRDTGEISPVTFDDYAETCKLFQKLVGKNRLVEDLRPDDWEKARK